MKRTNTRPENKCSTSLVGIIGGVGPHAGLDFMRKIFNNTIAVKDQDHISTVLISCPALIPDRTCFLLDEEKENPAEGMSECAGKLYAAGAGYVCVACNTAHSGRIFAPFCRSVEESFPGLRVVNMLETCAGYVKQYLPKVKTIGYLATKGTYASGVYREYFSADQGFTLIEPEIQGQERIHEAIYSKEFGIKAHSDPVHPKARSILLYETFKLSDRGADAVILGCTELPLAVNPLDFSIPILDPGLLTARRLIGLVAPEKLMSEPVLNLS
ncbi:amino acid racemase [Treponema sp. OttesenSCG-928-L16]|nr:amino acid racemase [Treponema sp. OttesenSCG-928-L16]